MSVRNQLIPLMIVSDARHQLVHEPLQKFVIRSNVLQPPSMQEFPFKGIFRIPAELSTLILRPFCPFRRYRHFPLPNALYRKYSNALQDWRRHGRIADAESYRKRRGGDRAHEFNEVVLNRSAKMPS
jgi:hypothetical protein